MKLTMKLTGKNILIIFLLFFISRSYILKFPPPFYSDVFHDYRRYANFWADGQTPYLKHFYEYPPATIPLLYTPLLIKNLGFGHYYQNYRAQIFIFDLILFSFILKALTKLKTKPKSKYLALGFYLLAPMIAKDFFYEGIDLVFIGSLTLALISLLFLSHKQQFHRLLFWLFFWLSTSIKFMSAPLLAVFAYLKNFKLVKELKAIALAFLLIWGLPLVIFRTSLAVMFVFHAQRGLKYASFPSFVVETINYFTHTETRLNQAPDFQLIGPVSTVVTKITAIVFPLSILLLIVYGLSVILKPRKKSLSKFIRQLLLLDKINLTQLDPYIFSLKISLIYIFTIFLTGKVFSQPFHIWCLPLITIFPFKSLKQQLSFMVLAIWLLIIDTTPWISINELQPFIGPLPMKFPLYLARFIPMIILLCLSFKLPDYEKAKS